MLKSQHKKTPHIGFILLIRSAGVLCFPVGQDNHVLQPRVHRAPIPAPLQVCTALLSSALGTFWIYLGCSSVEINLKLKTTNFQSLSKRWTEDNKLSCSSLNETIGHIHLQTDLQSQDSRKHSLRHEVDCSRASQILTATSFWGPGGFSLHNDTHHWHQRDWLCEPLLSGTKHTESTLKHSPYATGPQAKGKWGMWPELTSTEHWGSCPIWLAGKQAIPKRKPR